MSKTRTHFEEQLRELSADISCLSDKLSLGQPPIDLQATATKHKDYNNDIDSSNFGSNILTRNEIPMQSKSTQGKHGGPKSATDAYFMDKFKEDLHLARKEKDDAIYQLQQDKQELDQLRGKSQEFARLKAAYDHLKQDHDSLRVSFESSERIRKQQKELISLLQRSHTMVGTANSGSGSSASVASIETSPSLAHPATPFDMNTNALDMTMNDPRGEGEDVPTGGTKIKKTKKRVNSALSRGINPSVGKGDELHSQTSNSRSQRLGKAKNTSNKALANSMAPSSSSRYQGLGATLIDSESISTNNSQYNSHINSNSNSKEVSFSSQVLLNSSLNPRAGQSRTGTRLRSTRSLSPASMLRSMSVTDQDMSGIPASNTHNWRTKTSSPATTSGRLALSMGRPPRYPQHASLSTVPGLDYDPTTVPPPMTSSSDNVWYERHRSPLVQRKEGSPYGSTSLSPYTSVNSGIQPSSSRHQRSSSAGGRVGGLSSGSRRPTSAPQRPHVGSVYDVDGHRKPRTDISTRSTKKRSSAPISRRPAKGGGSSVSSTRAIYKAKPSPVTSFGGGQRWY